MTPAQALAIIQIEAQAGVHTGKAYEAAHVLERRIAQLEEMVKVAREGLEFVVGDDYSWAVVNGCLQRLEALDQREKEE